MTSFCRIIAAAAATIALGAGALLAAPVANAIPGDPEGNRAVVTSWYQDFLGRQPDAGSDYWTSRLDAGQREGDVLWQIAHSEEYDSTTIDLYYRILLNRSPDPGARYWVDGINAQRFPAEWAFQNILASPEYAAGKSRTMVIDGWYEYILERAPRPGEVAYWSGRIDAVGSLGALREVYYSNESVVYSIRNAYYLLLNREPSAGEINYWYPKQVENSVNVNVLIASTPEYRAFAIEYAADDQD